MPGPGDSSAPRGEVRVGLVGCGRLAQRGYAPAAARARGVRLAAVADPELERCAATAPGVPAFAGVQELIAQGGVDAVVIASPPGSHLEHARAASGHGLAVLVEKPPAPDRAGAHALAELAPAPWLGLNRRFQPGLLRLRARIGSEPVSAFSVVLHADNSDWRSYATRGDALLDFAPHCIDVVLWLSAQEARRVRATEQSEDRCVLELELERGRATLSCDRRSAYREEVELAGPGLRWSLPAPPLRRLRDRLTRSIGPDPLVASLARQLEALAAVVRGDDPGPLATAADGVAVMAVVDAARASAATGGDWTAVDRP